LAAVGRVEAFREDYQRGTCPSGFENFTAGMRNVDGFVCAWSWGRLANAEKGEGWHGIDG
jgi:hypothetical protein